MMNLKEAAQPIIKLWNKTKRDSFNKWGIRQKQASWESWERVANLFCDSLISAGFRSVGRGSFKTAYAKSDLPLVVKVFYDFEDKELDTPSAKPRSIRSHIIKNVYRDVMMMIQPLVDTSSEAKSIARRSLIDIYGAHICNRYDVSSDNVGLVDGEPVIFDYTTNKDKWEY